MYIIFVMLLYRMNSRNCARVIGIYPDVIINVTIRV